MTLFMETETLMTLSFLVMILFMAVKALIVSVVVTEMTYCTAMRVLTPYMVVQERILYMEAMAQILLLADMAGIQFLEEMGVMSSVLQTEATWYGLETVMALVTRK